MDIRNKLGQTPFDVADEGLVEHLEMLQKKQTVLRSEKETRNKLIEADMNGKPQSGLFTNKEKILYEEDTLKSMEMEEENKDSSSSSSEEEEEAEEDEVSESDAEKESERKEESFANHSSHETRPSITEQIPPPEPNSFTASARRFSWLNKSEEQKDESPSSWRLGLRKTGSHNMLSEVAATREAQRDKSSSIYRSSSSPRISALLDNKEKDKDNKSYLATIAPRRLSSTSDIEEKENRESAVNLVRSGSYTRQPWRDESKGNEAPHSGAPATYVSTYLKSFGSCFPNTRSLCQMFPKENQSLNQSSLPKLQAIEKKFLKLEVLGVLRSASFGRSSDLNSPYISTSRNTSLATSPTTIGSSTSLGTQWQPVSSCPTSLGANTTASARQYTRTPFRQQTDSAVEKNTEGISASTPLGVITNRAVLGSANGIANAGAVSTTGKDFSAEEARERRRSYLTPVRDEEAESLRKARSRQARQTRRSTQGVTLTDLQEAERTFSRSRAERQAQEQQSEKPESTEPTEDSSERQETRPRWSRSTDEETVYRRLRCPVQTDKPTTPVSPSTSAPLLYTSSYLTRANKYLDLDSVNPADFRGAATEMEKNECEDQDLDDRSPNKQSIRERRRPKERRRGTGIIFSTKDDDDEVDGNEEVKETRVSENHERLSRLESATNPTTSDTSSYSDRASSRSSAYTRRENRLASLSTRTEEESNRDYKKLYESALSENQKLKSKLQEAQLELADIKSKLEKAAQQKQEKTSDRSSMLEMEKREKRALERKLSEMEEEMKCADPLCAEKSAAQVKPLWFPPDGWDQAASL
ncbi:protein phosphatase 1 regulatory subunit 12B isoform X2 [Apteryx rowi]|uniref:protein phosphatase 1 regulatory subunit 12B isoform X2 n=1 Tax=Apteryx rowi TaxID=308060 RepID=UPI000E1D0655|nr:protein phosphatase 1 regulatory subunit 12B isoform X2 [Apteryx rowi]